MELNISLSNLIYLYNSFFEAQYILSTKEWYERTNSKYELQNEIANTVKKLYDVTHRPIYVTRNLSFTSYIMVDGNLEPIEIPYTYGNTFKVKRIELHSLPEDFKYKRVFFVIECNNAEVLCMLTDNLIIEIK